MKFTLSASEPYGNKSFVTHSFSADVLDDVLDMMDQFLKGCGYVYDGYVTIVPEEEDISEEDAEILDNWFGLDDSTNSIHWGE